VLLEFILILLLVNTRITAGTSSRKKSFLQNLSIISSSIALMFSFIIFVGSNFYENNFLDLLIFHSVINNFSFFNNKYYYALSGWSSFFLLATSLLFFFALLYVKDSIYLKDNIIFLFVTQFILLAIFGGCHVNWFFVLLLFPREEGRPFNNLR